MKPIIALDFDGVICNSMEECLLTAHNAYHRFQGSSALITFQSQEGDQLMQLVRYSTLQETAWGICDPDTHDVFTMVGNPYNGFWCGDRVGELSQLTIMAPCEPTKVVALAYNYKDLVGDRETFDEPLIFFKSPTSVIGPGGEIRIPGGIEVVWAEVELAFVIRKLARNVPSDEAADFILGYTIANDVTAQNVHGRDWHLARSKGLDTFCPVGPLLETELDTNSLELSTTINDRVTQHSTTANRILDDSEALSLISKFITLEPGDIVLTGTPAGALESRVQPGDAVTVRIAKLGELTNPVVFSNT